MTPRAKNRQTPLPLFWTRRAVEDLDTVGQYIAADDPEAARRWVLELMATAKRASRVPLAGRRVPELARDDIREVLLRSYRIVYRVTDERVDVLTVFEGHRRLPGLKLESA